MDVKTNPFHFKFQKEKFELEQILKSFEIFPTGREDI